MEHTEETLNIVCVIEEASKLSIYDIIDENIEPWITLWNEEIEKITTDPQMNELHGIENQSTI